MNYSGLATKVGKAIGIGFSCKRVADWPTHRPILTYYHVQSNIRANPIPEYFGNTTIKKETDKYRVKVHFQNHSKR